MRIPSRDTFGKEDGYAAVLTAMVLLPLMGFAGFAVDVGSWYARASALQRAADSAALAGVVWQPNFALADTHARAAATQNGFTTSLAEGITVLVTDTGDNRLEVQITDSDVDLYLAGLFLDNVTIGRQAVAEYVESVPLGSPESRFGTGPETFGGALPATNFYASINGFCAGKEQGDLIMSGYQGNLWAPCEPPDPGWTVNADYDARGYWYGIEKPEGSVVDIEVTIDHGGDCDSPDYNIGSNTGTFNTVYTLHAADDTPLNDYDNPVYATITAAPDTWCGDFETFFTIPGSGDSGRWFLNVQAPASDLASGLNTYSVWARRTGDTIPCSSLTESDCPQVFAVDNMGIWINSLSSVAEFYLAEIGSEHAGKSLKISMWDPAEGMDNIRFRDPSGNTVSFTWSASDGSSGSSTTCGGEDCLDVSSGSYNGHMVEVVIDLPTSATYATFPNDWFRVGYYSGGGTVTDRTTWRVEVLGDPVRLLE